MTSTTFFFIFIPLLAIILLAVNLIFAPHNPYQEKDSAFECGFHSFLGQNRTQFSISFFIFALLFLLFDLEILLVYPYIVSAYTNDIYGLSIMLIFFLVLTLGFAFELGKNALKIDSRQMYTVAKKQLNVTSYYSAIFLDKKVLSKLFYYFTCLILLCGVFFLIFPLDELFSFKAYAQDNYPEYYDCTDTQLLLSQKQELTNISLDYKRKIFLEKNAQVAYYKTLEWDRDYKNRPHNLSAYPSDNPINQINIELSKIEKSNHQIEKFTKVIQESNIRIQVIETRLNELQNSINNR